MVDALRALRDVDLDQAGDDAALAKLLTEALEEWPNRHRQLRELRQQAVIRMKEDGKSWSEIATIMGLKHHSRAQQIARGQTGPQSKAAKERRSGMPTEPKGDEPA